MRQIEGFLGAIAAAAFLATFVLAIINLGVLVLKGTPDTVPVVAASEPEAAPSASPAIEPGTQAVASAAAVDTEAGATVFKRKCKACHTAEKDGAHKVGPNLWSVFGAPVAGKDGFSYSDALTAAGDRIWDVALLEEFLENPKSSFEGSKMAFAGLKKAAERQNVIAFLAQSGDTPVTPEDLGFAAAAAAPEGTGNGAAEEEFAGIEPVPYPEGVTYRDPPAPNAEETARIAAAVEALEATLPMDYERARYHPLHFPPMIASASNDECLVCHQEILDHKPREASPAGVPATETIAWYQTLDTYEGAQESFHFRHLESDFARQVMNLQCTFCHKGSDPREESPDMVPTRAAFSAGAQPEHTLRKVVNPSTSCLRCHGALPDPDEIMGIGGPWHEVREDFEYAEAPNGCLSCHAESFRTVRHDVNYLRAASIEELAREGSSDSCYGCHGGRSWYRISYPYPRNAWPGMDEDVPEWAEGRPTASAPEDALPAAPAE